MNYQLLSNSKLFKGMSEEEIKTMLSCLGAVTKKYKRGEDIYRVGESIQLFGMVVEGGVNIESDDLWGNKSILSHIEPGFIFGETYASIPGEALLVNAVATENTEILFLNAYRVLETCPNTCGHHEKLIKNLLRISAQKNLMLSRRILHTSSKSIRGRLLAYFSDQAKLSGSYKFTIPFNRQQLADYLNVDRSAMSNELSKMKNDGIIEIDKNTFTLKEQL